MIVEEKSIVYCETLEQWQVVNSNIPIEYRLTDEHFTKHSFRYKILNGGGLTKQEGSSSYWFMYYYKNGYKIYNFDEFIIKIEIFAKNNEVDINKDYIYLTNLLKELNIK